MSPVTPRGVVVNTAPTPEKKCERHRGVHVEIKVPQTI